MNDIIELLKADPSVSAWRVTEKATVSYELFFVHRDLETVRATDTAETQVTVYVDHDGKRGDSTFTVYRSMNEADIAAKIENAAARAKLVFNEPYELPGAGTLEAALPTNMADADPKRLAADIADAVYAADDQPGGSINALEIFLYRDTVRVLNSSGVDKTQTTHRVMIEAIPTFTDDKESVELYEDHRFTSFDPAKVTAEIAEKMREVRDRHEAKKPQTPMKINVVLRPKETQRLLADLARDLNYGVAYSHANLHEIGDDLQKDCTGDRITLTMRGIVEGSERSAYFDDDGMTLTDICIIKDGKAAARYGSSRFGQYLGIEKPSGDLRCTEVAPGTLSETELASAPYLECASMSGLQVDLYNDYIGGEIRLAYYYDGEKTVPVTGITMSGRLSAVLSGLRLSETAEVSGAYLGPVKLLMPDMEIL
ncbi:MAG: hypothetical protein J5569_05605 [Oscillospiraceae bacterium]|nr:hypothetical protein [Oscillospiraceae bacterium]